MFTIIVLLKTFLTRFYNQISKTLSRTSKVVRINLRLATNSHGFPVAKLSFSLVKIPYISFSIPINTGVIAIIVGWLYWLGSFFT